MAWHRAAFVTIAIAVCAGCGGDQTGPGGGGGDAGAAGVSAGGSGSGGAVGVCPDEPNPGGPLVDMEWPAPSNVGHEALPGQTVRFHWTGSHNVLQVASFEGQEEPLSPLADAKWDGEIRSGDKVDGGTFEWNTGTFPCGYRPGLYFFVDQDEPAGGVVAVSLTDIDATHYAPRPCSVLAEEGVYGGRYRDYAEREGCTVFEVNNFQTATHFDWVPPIFTAKQGDLIVFRWTGNHNVVQVHDVTQDALIPGGIDSGDKTNCVGGPHYSCVNGGPELGEFLIDTKDYRPGIIHISDECAQTCTGSPTGVNMEFDLRFPVPNNTPLPPVPGSCCALDKSKGKDCRVVEIYNANDGAQLDYNVPVGRGDLVRFRWAGKLEIYQSLPNENGSPSKTPKPGGVAMAGPVECTPGPNMSCLEGTTEQAQLVFDVDAQIKAGNIEKDQFNNQWFDFFALGENTPGFTSADSGTVLYIDNNIPYNPNPTPCP